MEEERFLELPVTNRGVVTENSMLSASIDWVQITFQCNIDEIIENILGFALEFMEYEAGALFRYVGKMKFADIEIFIPPDDYKEMGYHLYLTGRACRQMEIYFTAQKRDWFDFFNACLKYEGKFTRLDIAIDDRKTHFDILELNEKVKNEECVSRFRNWSFYDKGTMNGKRAGRTLNFGSRSSDVYVVFYEKNYEQSEKLDQDVEDIGDWNRYEIRVKKNAANTCVTEMLKTGNIEYVGRSVLNNYIRFVIRNDNNKQRDLWRTWEPWQEFLDNSEKLRLTMTPAPRSLDEKKQWIKNYVAPTLKMLQKADDNLGDSFLKDTIDGAKFDKKHQTMLFDYLESHSMLKEERKELEREVLQEKELLEAGFRKVQDWELPGF